MQDELLPCTTWNNDEFASDESTVLLIKKITTRFQDGAEHCPVIEQEVQKLKLPPRLAIWTSSVDFQIDEQGRDRFIDVQIDESQAEAIIEFMKDTDKNPPSTEKEKFETAVCKELYLDLTTKLFFVEIPFTNEFKFPTDQNPRGYGIFSDMIKSMTALRYAIRKTNDQGHLMAEPDDFYEAKAVYEALMGHSEQKFTTSEQEVLKAIISSGYKADIRQLHNKTKKSESRLKDILNGRSKDEQKRYGLLARCTALTVDYETVSETKVMSEDCDPSDPKPPIKTTTCRKNIYTLDTGFELVDGKSELITPIPGTNLAECRPKIGNSGQSDVGDVGLT